MTAWVGWDAVGLDRVWLAGGGVLVGLAAAGAAALMGRAWRSVMWRGACWVAAGVWGWHWAGVDRWWAVPASWATLAVGGALAGVTASAFWSAERKARAEMQARAELRERAGQLSPRDDAEATEWERRLARVANIGRLEKVIDPVTRSPVLDPSGRTVTRLRDGAEIHRIVRWTDDDGQENGAGMDLHGLLPEGGQNWETIDAAKLSLASDAALPQGCGISVREGENRRGFVMHVQLKNILAGRFPYPPVGPPTSIRDDILVGYEPHGRAFTVNLYSDNATLTGEPNSGKTNTEHVVGAGIIQTSDALVIDIDIAGGGVSREYVRPWVEDPDHVPHPAVACPAPNAHIAYVVSVMVLRGIGDRKIAYGDDFVDQRVPISASLPQVIVRVDEGGALMGSMLGRMVRDNLEQVAGQGRPAGVRTLFCGLRGTNEFIPIDVLTLSPTRLGMRMSDETEARRYLGWSSRIDMAATAQEGCLLGKKGVAPPVPVKALWLNDEKRIREISRQVAARRPVLDPETVASYDQPVLLPDVEGLVEYFAGRPGFYTTLDDDGKNEQAWVENFWSNRWEYILPAMFKSWRDGASAPPARDAKPSPATSTTRGGVMELDRSTKEMQQSAGRLADAAAEMAADVAAAQARQRGEDPEAGEEAQGERGEDPDSVVVPDTPAELFRLGPARADIVGADQRPALRAPSPAHLTKREKVRALLELVEEASDGDPGWIKGGDLIAQLRGCGVTDAEQTVYGWLAAQLSEGTVDQPWGRGPGAPDSPKGAYVITDKGREVLRGK